MKHRMLVRFGRISDIQSIFACLSSFLYVLTIVSLSFAYFPFFGSLGQPIPNRLLRLSLSFIFHFRCFANYSRFPSVLSAFGIFLTREVFLQE